MLGSKGENQKQSEPSDDLDGAPAPDGGCVQLQHCPVGGRVS